MSTAHENLMQWTGLVKAYHIPRYDELPSIELYMDQVVAVIEEYLRIFLRDSREKQLTPAMINNYVKLKILPPPIKKKYGRTHLCYLIIICMLKQVLAISEIRDLINAQLETRGIKTVYNDFCDMQEQSFVLTLDHVVTTTESEPTPPFSDMILRTAVHANVNKLVAEKMIDIQTPPIQEGKKKDKEKD